MDELTLSTPTLLFSAVSLILLAYTNRFLSYAQLVRILKEQYVKQHSEVTAAQICASGFISHAACRCWESPACSSASFPCFSFTSASTTCRYMSSALPSCC